LQKVCTEDEFGVTEGFDACWGSHTLKHNATPPTGGWHSGVAKGGRGGWSVLWGRHYGLWCSL